jgi:hypothetical protein
MTETAGWGAAPGFLPPAVAMRMLRADAQDEIAAREAEAEREAHREELHQRHMALYQEQAAVRGELVSAVALATGKVPGRTVAEILAAGSAAGDREDLVVAARLHREGNGDPELLHVEVGEPTILHARSKTGWKIFNRARHFRDLLDARKALAEAEKAAERSRNDYGLVEGVTVRAKEDPVVVVSPNRRRSDSDWGPYDGPRFRDGGPIMGVR